MTDVANPVSLSAASRAQRSFTAVTTIRAARIGNASANVSSMKTPLTCMCQRAAPKREHREAHPPDSSRTARCRTDRSTVDVPRDALIERRANVQAVLRALAGAGLSTTSSPPFTTYRGVANIVADSRGARRWSRPRRRQRRDDPCSEGQGSERGRRVMMAISLMYSRARRSASALPAKASARLARSARRDRCDPSTTESAPGTT